MQHGIVAFACGKEAAVIGVGGEEIFPERVNDGLGDLCAAGVIEKNSV